jgi:hypothetical protein
METEKEVLPGQSGIIACVNRCVQANRWEVLRNAILIECRRKRTLNGQDRLLDNLSSMIATQHEALFSKTDAR